jgi:hypothetical protein
MGFHLVLIIGKSVAKLFKKTPGVILPHLVEDIEQLVPRECFGVIQCSIEACI